MKKIILILLLALASTFAFSETVVLSEDVKEEDNAGLLITVGDLFYYTNRFDEYKNKNRYADDLYANGFTAEIGMFNSDEDGLFDFVSSHTFGFTAGRVNTEDNYAWNDHSISYYAGNDAKFGNIYFKDMFGPQINFFVLSAGLLFGSNVGFDWLKMDADCNFRKYEYTYKEKRLYFDFAFQPYISFNVKHIVKIVLATEFDFPIVRARFIKDAYYGDYRFRFDWFGNDVPTSYKVGAVLFL